jgi:hypothetical protein
VLMSERSTRFTGHTLVTSRRDIHRRTAGSYQYWRQVRANLQYVREDWNRVRMCRLRKCGEDGFPI